VDLEKHGYYPQDLKCSNLILDDGHLWVIDLGSGLTLGMYRLEAEKNILFGNVEARDMLYTIGKTVWQLWDDEFSNRTQGTGRREATPSD
jgi:hypothetical protein